jgi:hypothetical protein
LLHAIVAVLSLLLLAGVFGRGMDALADESATPASDRETGRQVDDFPGLP